MHLRFLLVSSWLAAHFFYCWIIFHGLDVRQFTHSPSEGILVASKFWPLWRKQLWISMHRALCAHTFPASLGECHGALLPDHVQGVGNCPAAFQSGCTGTRLQQQWVSFCSFTPPSAFGAIGVLHLGHSNRCVVLFHCYFNLQFPKAVWCWASFRMFFFAMCMYFWGQYLFRSFAHFKIEFFFLKNWSIVDLQCCVSFRYTYCWAFKNCFYILDNNPLSDVSF